VGKGIVTQAMCLLTDGQPTIESLRASLQEQGFEIVNERPAQKDWRFGGPELTLAYRPSVNGYVAVDIVDQSWPDSMGDPKTDPMTFGAWSMGNFGPLTFPGGLSRASEHSWSWEPGKTLPKQHRGFIRLRLSYAFGAKAPDPLRPADCDPITELNFMSRAVLAILTVPGVICYFNPNGEVLFGPAPFRDLWRSSSQQEKIPLPLWINVRYFKLDQKFSLMDTVGNGQLDVADVEAIFPQRGYDPGDVGYYLRNVTQYLLGLDREIHSGEAFDGPGEANLSWVVEVVKQGTIKPPREIYRLYPKANKAEISKALEG